MWQLAELQSKVRSDVGSEYWLNVKCAYPDRQLFDWGMMRLHRPLYGVGDPFAMDADDQIRKKRDAEVIFYLIHQLPTPLYFFLSFGLNLLSISWMSWTIIYICRC